MVEWHRNIKGDFSNFSQLSSRRCWRQGNQYWQCRTGSPPSRRSSSSSQPMLSLASSSSPARLLLDPPLRELLIIYLHYLRLFKSVLLSRVQDYKHCFDWLIRFLMFWTFLCFSKFYLSRDFAIFAAFSFNKKWLTQFGQNCRKEKIPQLPLLRRWG